MRKEDNTWALKRTVTLIIYLPFVSVHIFIAWRRYNPPPRPPLPSNLKKTVFFVVELAGFIVYNVVVLAGLSVFVVGLARFIILDVDLAGFFVLIVD